MKFYLNTPYTLPPLSPNVTENESLTLADEVKKIIRLSISRVCENRTKGSARQLRLMAVPSSRQPNKSSAVIGMLWYEGGLTSDIANFSKEFVSDEASGRVDYAIKKVIDVLLPYEHKVSVAFNDDFRLPLWDRYYNLGLIIEKIAKRDGTREENTELESRVAGNDQGSLALDEQSQNVKGVIARYIRKELSIRLDRGNEKKAARSGGTSNFRLIPISRG
ncbi:unnamed protein product [Rhizophagus irregularis]|nr:unnamed protein product [Rhizophagus irregularis]